jgi:hypothetical protein
MNQIKCAICKKRIKDFDRYLVIGYGISWPQYSLCSKCGAPIAVLLEQHGLISFTEANDISWNANQK